MKKLSLTGLILLVVSSLAAQKGSVILRKGNNYYKKQEFAKAEEAYNMSLEKDPSVIGYYNLGNARFRNDKDEEAIASFKKTIEVTRTEEVKEKAWYNKGVVEQNQEKLKEAAESYKNALRIDPDDTEARQNLQKALEKIKEAEQKEQQKNDKKQPPPPKKEKKKEPPPPKPQPKPSKLSMKKAEQLLETLREREKEVQEKFQLTKTGVPSQPEKDW